MQVKKTKKLLPRLCVNKYNKTLRWLGREGGRQAARGGVRGKAMGNLAGSYSKLGRHEDALLMQERVLEFRRRVLPENHPSIGEGDVWCLIACF